MLQAIKDKKYTLEWVGSYEEGLESISQNKHDAYLIDYRLAGKNGLDLIREVIAKIGSRQPMIMLTGFSAEDLDELSLSIGASDFLPKQDLSPRVLDRAVRHAITRKKQEKLLRDKASQDPLTGLANRRMVNQVLPVMVTAAKRRRLHLAVFFLDLDGFKEINDTYGHATGDAVLKAVAGRWSQLLRPHDLLARLGGDEFLAIIVNQHLPGLSEKLAQRFLNAFNNPLKINDQTVPLSVSIGVAMYPDHARNAQELLEKADQAMYEVKKSGKNGYRLATPGQASDKPH